MNRLIAIACLSLPNLALGQSGVTITTGPGVIDPGSLHLTTPIETGLGEFQPIFSESAGRIFPVHLDFLGAAHAQQRGASDVPWRIGATALEGESVVITIEDEGVRLPDEHFSLD
jgi:hypothetical protein